MFMANKGVTMYYTRFDCNLCEVTVIGDTHGIKRIHLNAENSNKDLSLKGLIRDDSLFIEAKSQIQNYFNGKSKKFDLKLNPEGTDFQKKVWQALQSIPYGETVTYKDIAIKIGNEKASRAVGMANGKNPIPIIVPCHRVIGSNGKLTGYAFGVPLKNKLILLEKNNIDSV